MRLVAYFRETQKQLYATVGLIVLSLVMGLFFYLDYRDEQELADNDSRGISAPPGEISLEIDVIKRTLVIMSDGTPYKQYRIAVGKSETPTPIGEWKVVWKDSEWGTGFGSRWMGLNVPWGTFGIHGTNKPWSIGRFASHGCIRMHNRSVEQLFDWVPVGTPVKIIGPTVKVKRNLKINMSGPDVVVLQKKLREIGVYYGRADGIFGIGTAEAVTLFQEKNGLPATGSADKETRKILGFSE
jgi:hypothetical protein